MADHAAGSFKVESWDEENYAEIGSGRLTRASVRQRFAGDIEGRGSVEWLMAYGADDSAHFIGLQHVDGRLGDRSGEFVLETTGTFDGQVAEGEWSVVPGSATAELRGLRGSGGFRAPLGPEASVTLDYDFD